MKRIAAIVLFLVMLSGCGGNGVSVDRPLQFRKNLNQSSGYTFDAVITADYGNKCYEFELSCKVNNGSEFSFCVVNPETISGISGIISEQSAALTFDDKILVFEMLADGQITPVIAPWLTIRALTSGFISACGTEGELLHVQIDDSFYEIPLKLDVWFDTANHPVRAEILWDGRRILSLEIKNFEIL